MLFLLWQIERELAQPRPPRIWKVVHVTPLSEAGVDMQDETRWRWLNPDTNQVETWHCITTFQEHPHELETEEEFHARHLVHVKEDRVTHPKIP